MMRLIVLAALFDRRRRLARVESGPADDARGAQPGVFHRQGDAAADVRCQHQLPDVRSLSPLRTASTSSGGQVIIVEQGRLRVQEQRQSRA